MTETENKIIEKIKAVPYPNYSVMQAEKMKAFNATFVGTKNQLKEAEKQLEEDITTDFREALKVYHNKQNALDCQLKEIVREEMNMSEKVFTVIWEKAWEKHSGGYEEVIDEAKELCYFANDIMTAAMEEMKLHE